MIEAWSVDEHTWLSMMLTILPSHVTKPNTTFDYVIVGGGTAGLVLANRLSVFPHVRVAVIESGGDERANLDVTSSDGV
jgi:ribulose 1,5-bisphosphate synthetase/thiazole synthase